MTGPIPAKFFVNEGVVTSRTDMLHLLRPLLKQTITYRYLRGRDVVAHGTGWMERIVVDADDTSTYFTPLAITLNTHATVAHAAAMMAMEDFHHLMVVGNDHALVGVVSTMDVVRWLARNDGFTGA